MAILTGRWETGRSVFGIACPIEIRTVASKAIGWGIGIITVVAIRTTDVCMCTVQDPIIVVDRESGWRPAWCGGVAHGTICWYIQQTMVRVRALIEVSGMAS